MVVTGLPKERVRFVADWPEDVVPPLGGQDLSIRVLGFATNDPDGAGRLETILERQLGIMLRTQMAADYGEYADAWLLDPTFGHVFQEENIFNALQSFIPTDSNGNILVAAPINLVSGESPERKNEDTGTGKAIYLFRLRYLPPITTTDLGPQA
jgi:hypothetical protein